MKDKLEKTGLTRSHYRKQLVLKLSLFVVAFVTVCALPIGLSYRVAEVVKAEKLESSSQEETSSQKSEISSEMDEIEEYQKNI